MRDQTFDMVLLDHLIGSLEIYWPHGHDQLLSSLSPILAPNGRICVIGQDPEPHPSRFEIPGTPSAIPDPGAGKAGYHMYHAIHIHRSVNDLAQVSGLPCCDHHRLVSRMPLTVR